MFYIISFILALLSVLSVILCVKLEISKIPNEIKDPYGSVSSLLHVVTFLLIVCTVIHIVYPNLQKGYCKIHIDQPNCKIK